MATLRFINAGTDATQDFSAFAGTFASAGSVTSATDQAHTGLSSIKVVVPTANNAAYAWTNDGAVADAGTGLSIWVRFSTAAPSVATAFLVITAPGDGASIFALGLNTNGTLAFSGQTLAGPSFSVNGTTVVQANTWIRITLSYLITSASSWAVKTYINGVQDISTSNAISGNTLHTVGTSDVEVGVDTAQSFSGSSAITIWYDDLFIDARSDLSDPGNIAVVAKRPFANGTSNQFATQVGSGGSGYGTGHAPQVNERPLNATDGWAGTVVAAALTEEYNIEGVAVGDANLTGATILGYNGWIYAKSIASESDNLVLTGSTSVVVLPVNTATYFNALKTTGVYPPGTGTDIGLQTNTAATTATLYKAGIEIAYIPGPVGAVDGPNPGVKPYALDLRTSISNLLQSTLGPAVAVPLLPIDTTATPTRVYPLDLRTALNNLIESTLAPTGNPAMRPMTDSPPVRAYPLDLRTTTNNLLGSTLAPPVIAPFVGHSDALPAVRPYPSELRTTTVGLLESTLAPAAAVPFTPPDLPNPPVRPYPLELRTSISFLIGNPSIPPVVSLFDVPPVRTYPLGLRTQTNNLLANTLGIVVGKASGDLPLPTVTHPYPVDLRSATLNLIANTLKPAATFPLVAEIDQLPPVKPYPLDLRSATNTLITTTLKPAQTFPLLAQELGLVFGRPYALELRTSTLNLLETTLAPVVGAPSVNYDQPLPAARPLYPVDLRTSTNDLLQSTLGPAAVVPVHPVDTTGTFTKPYPLDLRTSAYNLLLTTLIPPPPVAQVSDLARPNTPAYPSDLRTSTSDLLSTTLVPPNVPVHSVDFGLTFVRPYPLDLRTTTNNLLQGTLALVPLFLVDQPLPAARPAFPADLRTQTNTLITTTLKPAQTFPEVSLVDALPPVRPYPGDLRTATVDIITTTLVPPPPAPKITDVYKLGAVDGFGNSHRPGLGGMNFAPELM